MREATIARTTTETDIRLYFNADGTGQAELSTGVGFLDHMLELFARHGRFDLNVECIGDTHVDDHHSVEDIGIVLGQALAKALGDCRGIRRYGGIALPMDEALVLVALDICGRTYLNCDLALPCEKVGTFDCELVQEFLLAFARSANLTLHVRQMDGSNAHHIIEAVFKGLGRSLRQAVEIDPASAEEIPSTKGVL